MGCDIHIRTEAFKEFERGGSAWVNVDTWMYHESEQAHNDPPSLFAIDIWNGRNYELFSILANVRNYDGIEIMGEPRGLPTDVSKVTKDDYIFDDEHRFSCHHASYWTLAELKAFYECCNSHECLKGLIDSIEVRKDDVFRYGDVENMDEKIRIVFWFDN